MSDMAQVQEEEIRRALAAEALAYEPPADLSRKTVAAVRAAGRPGLVARLRSRAESRRAGRKRNFSRPAFAGMALAVLIGLYGVGYMSLMSGDGTPRRNGEPFNALAPGQVQTDPGGDAIRRSSPPVGESDVDSFMPVAPGCEGGNCAVAPDATGAAQGSKGDGGSGGASSSVGSGPLSSPSGQSRAVAEDQPAPGVAPIPGPAPNSAAGPGVIRTGQMEVRVRKGGFGTAWAQATSIAAKHGGVVASSSADQVEGSLSRGTLTVRVPAGNLDAALADFQRLGRVMHLTSSSSDVSGQLVDFDARIRAAQARELQLLELLRQARSVSDSLQVGTALSQVRTEIESLQAQRANLQGQVDLASLTVSMYEPQAAPEFPGPFEGRLAGAWQRAVDAGALTLSAIVIGAGFVLPLAGIALIVWAGLRLRRRAALR